jgi:hypothetical protein
MAHWPSSGLSALILTFFVLISGQAAQACPEHGMHGAHNMSAHNMSVNVPPKGTPVIASTIAPFELIAAGSGDADHKGTAHSCPCGCQTGCCSACSAAIGVTISTIDFSEHSNVRPFPGLTSLVSHEPTPQFRPPRILI